MVRNIGGLRHLFEDEGTFAIWSSVLPIIGAFLAILIVVKIIRNKIQADLERSLDPITPLSMTTHVPGEKRPDLEDFFANSEQREKLQSDHKTLDTPKSS